jgi:Protein of unknown function (DUF1344)
MGIKRMIALSTLLAAGTVGMALAQDQSMSPAASGTVLSVDPASRTVVLDDGQAYMMGEQANMGAIKPGSSVNMSCEQTGTNCMVEAALPPSETGGKTNTGPSAGAAEDISAGAAEDAAPPSSEQGTTARASQGSAATVQQ